MDYKSFLDLLVANPKSKLAFASGKAGEVSGRCAVVEVVKASNVVLKMENKGSKFFETCENALKVLAEVSDADALAVSVDVGGKVFVLDSATAEEGYVLGKVS